MVSCIDDISYNFTTFLYSTFIEEIDNAFFNSNYRKQFCEVINIQERNIVTLFGEVTFKRRYYYDKFKNKSYFYVDQVLNIKPYSRFDPFVCAKVCEVSSHDSYAKAGRTETINNKMNYILNNWKYIQVYYHKNPMKCCIESNISHCFADIFTARPRAYSEKRLRQLLKLRLLKVNNQDIQKIYFGILNNEFNKEIPAYSELITYTKRNVDIFHLPLWLDKYINLNPI